MLNKTRTCRVCIFLVTGRPSCLPAIASPRAIARAIAPRPQILLADEPTGNLDSGTSEKVIATLFDATEAAGAALVLVTHDPALAERCGRVLTIEDGVITDDRATGLEGDAA